MKKYINKLLLSAFVGMFLFSACKKEGTNVTYQSGTPPVLTASVADTIALSASIKDSTAIGFTWTNPNYQFSNGISSLNVSYNLEFDTVGANFTSPNMQTVSISSALGTSFTVDQINTIVANKLLLAVGIPHNIQVKVVSFITPYTSGSPIISPLSSNVLSFECTPYSPPPVVTPPTSGTLFLVGGDPAIGAWSNPVPTSQQFTQVSPTDYQLTIALSGGNPLDASADDQYLILPVNGSWSHKYACNNTATQPFSGGTFGLDLSSNFPGPTAAGTYLFDMNFQTGILTVTKQ
jgi:hypothetical protein